MTTEQEQATNRILLEMMNTVLHKQEEMEKGQENMERRIEKGQENMERRIIRGIAKLLEDHQNPRYHPQYATYSTPSYHTQSEEDETNQSEEDEPNHPPLYRGPH